MSKENKTIYQGRWVKNEKFEKLNLEGNHCHICTLGMDETDKAFLPPQNGLERHHVYGGVANRPISERQGFVVNLCPTHHRNGKDSVHQNYEVNLALKQYVQGEFEKRYTREQFRALIGCSYL